MPVQTKCPHCATPCLVGEQHLEQMVRCYACARVFRLRGTHAPNSSAPPTDWDDAELPLPSFDGEPEPEAALTLDVGSATTAGKVREANEDAFLVRRQAWSAAAATQEVMLLAVADGMGGYGGGEKASALTVHTLQTALAHWFDKAVAGRIEATQSFDDALRAALNEASKVVHTAALTDPALKGMGAAAVVALIWRDQAHIAHVGDCRAYHFHDGKLRQATKDQTLLQRMLDLGTLQPHEAQHHPAKNELSQALGRRPDVAPEICQLALSRDDWLLLASDGLHTHLSHVDLHKEVTLALPSAAFLAQRLIDVANERGGSDNCTVIAVHR
jgi:PPM family protein phosphatase